MTLPPIPAAPVILADGISEQTKDYLSMLVGADPIDEQVFIALTVLRQSGAAVMNDGQRFQDIRKLTTNAALLIEQEARTALKRLVAQGDIAILRITTTTDSAGNWAECVADYFNNRLPKPAKRQVRAPLRPEVTSV